MSRDMQQYGMIVSFRHRGLKRFYEHNEAVKLPADKVERIASILASLDVAETPDDLDRPSYRLHPLKGRRKNEWSITVRANWRITFCFDGRNVCDVNLEDYH